VNFEWRPLVIGEAGRVEDQSKTLGTEEKHKNESRENVLAYWTPEVTNQPARVALMSFPGRVVIRQKQPLLRYVVLVSLITSQTESSPFHQCKLFWHDQGNFLCVKVDRHAKTKRRFSATLRSFTCARRNVLWR